MGNRFTILGLDDPIGFFFEALYRTGFYWRFLNSRGPALNSANRNFGGAGLLSPNLEYVCDYGLNAFYWHARDYRSNAFGEHLPALLGL